MMSHQLKVRMLVSINLVLALAIALGLVFSPVRSTRRVESRTILADADVVSRIHIGGPEPLNLVKSGTDWVLLDLESPETLNT
ncbi:MAG: hypothetical protein AB7T74_04560, partial [Clostridia bacterium]